MIDDNPADGETVRRFFSDKSIPWEVNLTVCLDPRQAEQLLSEQNFDVIIIDYHFPFGTGFDLLKKLKTSGVDIPTIMLTGQGSEQVAAEAVSSRLDGYIPKNSLSPERLKKSIESVLDPKAIVSESAAKRRTKTSQKGPGFATTTHFLQHLNKHLQENSPSPFFLIQLTPSNQQTDFARVARQLFSATLKKSIPQNSSLYQIRDRLAAGFCCDFPKETPSFSTLENNLIEIALQLDTIELPEPEELKTYFCMTGVKIDYSSGFFDPGHLLNSGIDHILTLESTQHFETITINYEYGRNYSYE